MDCNDYELVSLAKEGNEDAINILYEKYKPIIVKKSKNAIINVNACGIEINDVMQECYMGLDEAINNFSEENNVSFYTFAILCINRKIINFIRHNWRTNNRFLNESVFIDDYMADKVKSDFDIEMNFINEDDSNTIIENLCAVLTEFEKLVLKYKIEGYSTEEIANTLNKDVKSIYNSIHRIKIKFKNICDKEKCL